MIFDFLKKLENEGLIVEIYISTLVRGYRVKDPPNLYFYISLSNKIQFREDLSVPYTPRTGSRGHRPVVLNLEQFLEKINPKLKQEFLFNLDLFQ